MAKLHACKHKRLLFKDFFYQLANSEGINLHLLGQLMIIKTAKAAPKGGFYSVRGKVITFRHPFLERK